jgi:hypothetical protein
LPIHFDRTEEPLFRPHCRFGESDIGAAIDFEGPTMSGVFLAGYIEIPYFGSFRIILEGMKVIKKKTVTYALISIVFIVSCSTAGGRE